MIDGFRHGFFGVSDVSPVAQPRRRRHERSSLVSAIALALLRSGYKLRH
jgi:ABC-2 type transport system permease protein